MKKVFLVSVILQLICMSLGSYAASSKEKSWSDLNKAKYKFFQYANKSKKKASKYLDEMVSTGDANWLYQRALIHLNPTYKDFYDEDQAINYAALAKDESILARTLLDKFSIVKSNVSNNFDFASDWYKEAYVTCPKYQKYLPEQLNIDEGNVAASLYVLSVCINGMKVSLDANQVFALRSNFYSEKLYPDKYFEYGYAVLSGIETESPLFTELSEVDKQRSILKVELELVKRQGFVNEESSTDGGVKTIVTPAGSLKLAQQIVDWANDSSEKTGDQVLREIAEELAKPELSWPDKYYLLAFRADMLIKEKEYIAALNDVESALAIEEVTESLKWEMRLLQAQIYIEEDSLLDKAPSLVRDLMNDAKLTTS